MGGDEVWIGAVDGVSKKKKRDWCPNGWLCWKSGVICRLTNGQALDG